MAAVVAVSESAANARRQSDLGLAGGGGLRERGKGLGFKFTWAFAIGQPAGGAEQKRKGGCLLRLKTAHFALKGNQTRFRPPLCHPSYS